MEQYKSYFSEADDDIEESPFDKRIDSILKTLKTENFYSEEQRKKFIDLISSLHNSKDPRARKSFRYMSDLFSEIGDDLINMKKEE